jgi:hypothetical protein
MAGAKHTFTLAWRTGTGATKSTAVEVTGDTEINVPDLTVAAADTDEAVTIGIDVSELQSAYITSDKDVTLKTNSTGSPADTLTIKANKPLVWYKDSGQANPFTSGTDVTSLHFANAGAADAVVNACFLVNNSA